VNETHCVFIDRVNLVYNIYIYIYICSLKWSVSTVPAVKIDVLAVTNAHFNTVYGTTAEDVYNTSLIATIYIYI